MLQCQVRNKSYLQILVKKITDGRSGSGIASQDKRQPLLSPNPWGRIFGFVRAEEIGWYRKVLVSFKFESSATDRNMAPKSGEFTLKNGTASRVPSPRTKPVTKLDNISKEKRGRRESGRNCAICTIKRKQKDPIGTNKREEIVQYGQN